MKKLAFSLLSLSCLCGSIANANNLNYVNQGQWTGTYIGVNAGYWWSQNNKVKTEASILSMSGIDPVGASNIANALTIVGTNHLNNNPNGFIGGAQLGYNYQINYYSLGLELSLAGLSQSNDNNQINKSVALVDFPESYQATFKVSNKINYLAALRARIGFIATPSILIYGTGGLGYADINYKQSITANETLSAFTYPTVYGSSSHNGGHTGWTLGAGAEWMFMPQWSAKIEYNYYSFGNKNSHYTLTQVNNLEIPSVDWASVNVNSSSTQFNINTIEVGLNYHFC